MTTRDTMRRNALILLPLAVTLLLAGACRRGETPPPAPATPSVAATTPADARSPLPTDNDVFLPQIALGAGQETAPAPTAAPTATAILTPTLAAAAVLTPTLPPAPAATPTPRPLALADWPAMTLQDWPRPAHDNGLCLHNTAVAYNDEADIDLQIGRLQSMNMRWTLIHYGDELQLLRAAPRYRDAGITVVWRKNVRAYDRYYDWGRDVQLLLDMGVAPYMQLYNEPELPAEWDGQPIDQQLFLDNLMLAVEQVYNAGGYVGLQFVSDDWLRAALREIKARGGEQVFQRMFLVPHPYGLNHPPDYMADPNGVLGFLHQARIVEEEIGFVPPMIAGEGGWKWNATDDRNFPPIDAALHRDYHVELFNWFRTGVLSNGEPLPDTLLAFCPWLLSDRGDDSAWFDSFAGERTLTVEGVRAIPAFERRFSWQ
ncbi:MAG TPA: hypothetical protein PKL67_04450 [Anaerolineae bacterium]|nr:hypothetical protein [Anaerolineae bacterium]